MAELSPLFVFGAAAFSGSIVLAGTIVLMQRSVAFRRRWYWVLLLGLFAYCWFSPFLYIWTSPHKISYADALLLKVLYVGSRRIAESYFLFIGAVLGGAIGFALPRHSDEQTSQKRQ